MGFTTGFVGGLTLTYSVLYLTLHMHRENRIHQAALLSQQRSLLTHLYDPPSEIYDSPAYEIRAAGLSEQLKDRWNRELSSLVRNLQQKDWEATRITWEARAGNVWKSIGGTQAVQEARDKIVEAGESAKGKAVEVKDSLVARGKDVKENLKSVTLDAKRDAKEITGQKRLLEL